MPRPSKSDVLQIRISPADKARLRRRADRAGKDVSTYVLDRVLPAESLQFEGLVAAVRTGDRRQALAALHDFLAGLERREFMLAVEGDPLRTGDDPWLGNYLAAMVEHAAARHGAPPPAWVRATPPLAEPWFASRLLSLRLHLLLNAPPAFRRRNLFVDAAVGDRV